MIQRGNLAVCVIASRGCRCGPIASTYACARRTRAREPQTDHLSRRSRVFRRMRKTLLIALLVCSGDRDYACAFFFAAQRAFISSDNFFLAAGLMGRRAAAFLGGVLTCFGADFPLHFAHRCFMAAEIRLRAAALIVRRFPPADAALGGRPRLGADEVSPSSAEMAWSRRSRAALNSETRFWISIEFFPIPQARHIVAVKP